MSKNKTKLLAIAALASCMALGAVSIAGSTFLGNRGEVFALDSAYNLALNSSNATYTDGEVIATASGQPVALAFSGASASSGNFCALSSGGYIANTREILGIKKLNLNFTGTIKLYAGACKNHWATEETMTASGEFALPKTANFFKIEAQGAATIASIEATYACEEADKSGISHTAGDKYSAYDAGDNIWIAKLCTVCGEPVGTHYTHEKMPSAPEGIWNYTADTYGFALQSDGYYKSTNAGKGGSSAIASFTATKDGQMTFDWKVSSESGCDQFTVLLGTTMKVTAKSGEKSSSESETIKYSTGDVIKFVYQKDSSVDSGSDCAWFRIVEMDYTYAAITFDSCGGDAVDPALLANGSPASALPTPTKENYDFGGWYLESGYVTKVTSATKFSGDTVLYAKWVEQSGPVQANPVSGLTFTGIYQDEYSNQYRIRYIFEEGDDVVGEMRKVSGTSGSGYAYPKFAVTGAFDGTTLTITSSSATSVNENFRNKVTVWTMTIAAGKATTLTCVSNELLSSFNFGAGFELSVEE